MQTPSDPGPLKGLRVLDVTQMLAGPLCGMRLGDLGADVIKIETPGKGDWNRDHGFTNAFVGGESTAWLGLNRNKRSVTINLKHPEGQCLLQRLVEVSDVLIQNFRVGTAERLGMGYEKLHEINPGLIHCSVSGYGERGPYAKRPGQDLVVQGYSGSLWSVGSKEDPPTPSALWAADAMTAYHATIGILAALHGRDSTGVGDKVEVDLLSAVMDAQVQELVTYLNLGILPQRTAEPLAHAWINAPYGIYPTKDGYLTLAMTPLHVLGEALGNDRLREMTSWEDGVEHRDEVYRIVQGATPSRTTAEWIEVFDRHNVWAGPVYDYADLAADPHVVETGMLTSVPHPTAGDLRMTNVPIKLRERPGAVRRHPPLLGEHTAEVLVELLDLGEDTLDELRADGVI